jgi:hypothetical protein
VRPLQASDEVLKISCAERNSESLMFFFTMPKNRKSDGLRSGEYGGRGGLLMRLFRSFPVIFFAL